MVYLFPSPQATAGRLLNCGSPSLIPCTLSDKLIKNLNAKYVQAN